MWFETKKEGVSKGLKMKWLGYLEILFWGIVVVVLINGLQYGWHNIYMGH
jgi:hypothetical protein